MKDRHDLDPDAPALSREVEGALAERVAPLAPADPGALRERLLARVRAGRADGVIHVPLNEGEWRQLLPGVRVKCLAAVQRAFLLDLAPGARLPFHRHHQDEECVVLRGQAQLGPMEVRAGDYHLARAGSRHGQVRSREGALLYLRGTPLGHGGEVLRDLAGALLPGAGEAPLTLPDDGPDWQDDAQGGRRRTLRHATDGDSQMLRLAAGESATLPAGAGETLVVAGEAFFPERLLMAGDYRIAPQAAGGARVSSDVGALLFVRSAPAT